MNTKEFDKLLLECRERCMNIKISLDTSRLPKKWNDLYHWIVCISGDVFWWIKINKEVHTPTIEWIGEALEEAIEQIDDIYSLNKSNTKHKKQLD